MVTVFTYLFIVLRLTSRYMLAKLWWDDGFIILTAVSVSHTSCLKVGRDETAHLKQMLIGRQILMVPMTIIPIYSMSLEIRKSGFVRCAETNERC